jgi:hypothetical protein
MNRRIYRATSKRALPGGGLHPAASPSGRTAPPFGSPEAAPGPPPRSTPALENLGARR